MFIDTQKKLCTLLDVGLHQSYNDLVIAAQKNLTSDFWALMDNIDKLLTLQYKAGCTTEIEKPPPSEVAQTRIPSYF